MHIFLIIFGYLMGKRYDLYLGRFKFIYVLDCLLIKITFMTIYYNVLNRINDNLLLLLSTFVERTFFRRMPQMR